MDGTKREARSTLPSSLSSAGAARGFVRKAVEPLVPHDVLETIELLTSEIVTNAVVHADGEPIITVVCRDNTVRVSVEDRNPAWPVRQAVPATALCGRGLAIVDDYAASWGVERLPQSGKRVWFEVRS